LLTLLAFTPEFSVCFELLLA